MRNVITRDNKNENYYISYNSSKRGYGVDTTALVITIGDNERRLFYILEGNHLEAYSNLRDLKSCINYIMENNKLIHDFSDEIEHGYLLSS